MKRAIVIITTIILGIGLIIFLTSRPKSPSQPIPETRGLDYETKMLSIGNKVKLTVELADTPEKRTQGLSYRTSLAPDRGMLFLFDQPAQHVFWMKDMNFPIDIIWIRDTTIVGIEQNVPPPDAGAADSELPTYAPPEPINSVLEVNGGFSRDNSITTGDTVVY